MKSKIDKNSAGISKSTVASGYTHDSIYLIDMGEDVVWSDNPTPTLDMKESDSLKYVRADYTSCLICGGDQQTAKLARMMGCRHDIAFAKVAQARKKAEKMVALYHVVNKMMMKLGADGEVNATDDIAVNVMDALFAIDGGQYDNGFDGV